MIHITWQIDLFLSLDYPTSVKPYFCFLSNKRFQVDIIRSLTYHIWWRTDSTSCIHVGIIIIMYPLNLLLGIAFWKSKWHMNKIRISPMTRYEATNFIDREIYALDLKKVTLLKLLKVHWSGNLCLGSKKNNPIETPKDIWFRQPSIVSKSTQFFFTLAKITTKSIDNDVIRY